MFAFEILERIESVVGGMSFRIEKKAGNEVIEIGMVLTDAQLEQALATVSDKIGKIVQGSFKTRIELLA